MDDILQVGVFDLDIPSKLDDLNKLLASKNVSVKEHQLGFTPMGECKMVIFYRIRDPKNFDLPISDTSENS